MHQSVKDKGRVCVYTVRRNEHGSESVSSQYMIRRVEVCFVVFVIRSMSGKDALKIV